MTNNTEIYVVAAEYVDAADSPHDLYIGGVDIEFRDDVLINICIEPHDGVLDMTVTDHSRIPDQPVAIQVELASPQRSNEARALARLLNEAADEWEKGGES